MPIHSHTHTHTHAQDCELTCYSIKCFLSLVKGMQCLVYIFIIITIVTSVYVKVNTDKGDRMNEVHINSCYLIITPTIVFTRQYGLFNDEFSYFQKAGIERIFFHIGSVSTHGFLDIFIKLRMEFQFNYHLILSHSSYCFCD